MLFCKIYLVVTLLENNRGAILKQPFILPFLCHKSITTRKMNLNYVTDFELESMHLCKQVVIAKVTPAPMQLHKQRKSFLECHVVSALKRVFNQLLFISNFHNFLQSETEYDEWMKEIRRANEEAQIMVRTGAKIMSNSKKNFHSQSSKDSIDNERSFSSENHV